MKQRTIETKAYGVIPIEERQIVSFPLGLYGFEGHREFALLDSDTPPFYWLQSMESREVAFILVNPYVIVPEYVLDISEDDLDTIENPAPEDLLVFAIVTIPAERRDMSCNLQGPVIIHRDRRIGRQSISLDQRWPIKRYLLPREGRESC